MGYLGAATLPVALRPTTPAVLDVRAPRVVAREAIRPMVPRVRIGTPLRMPAYPTFPPPPPGAPSIILPPAPVALPPAAPESSEIVQAAEVQKAGFAPSLWMIGLLVAIPFLFMRKGAR